jgi:hypothetical protein
MADDVSGSLDDEQTSPIKPATSLRRLSGLWPWVWLALSGVATLGWMIGLGWAAARLVGWVIG